MYLKKYPAYQPPSVYEPSSRLYYQPSLFQEAQSVTKQTAAAAVYSPIKQLLLSATKRNLCI